MVEDRSSGIGVGAERSIAGQGKGAAATLDKSDVGSTAAQEAPIISTCAAVDREDGKGAAGIEDPIIPQCPRDDASQTGEGLVFPVHIQSDKATGSGAGIAINRQYRGRRQCIGDAESQLNTCVGGGAVQQGRARIGACPIEDKVCGVGVAARRVLENQTAGSAHRAEGEVGSWVRAAACPIQIDRGGSGQGDRRKDFVAAAIDLNSTGGASEGNGAAASRPDGEIRCLAGTEDNTGRSDTTR